MDAAADFMPYLLALIGFFATYVLNGIRGEIKEVKTSLQSLEKDLRDGVSSLDRRVTAIETRCCMEHSKC